MTTKEQQLISKAKNGDSSATTWIYEHYAPILLGICMRYINNSMEAEDVLQDSFITIFEKMDQLQNNKAFIGWSKKIVVNKALRFLKNQPYNYGIEEYNEEINAEVVEAEAPKNLKEAILQMEVEKEEMLSIINNMPIGFRTVFNMYVFEKMKHHEIAEQLDISVGTSKSQLLRARKQVQEKLIELYESKKKKKREKVLLTSLLISMDKDLDYIDDFAFGKLNDITIKPSVKSDQLFYNKKHFQKASTAKASFFKGIGFVKMMVLSGVLLSMGFIVKEFVKKEPVKVAEDIVVMPEVEDAKVVVPKNTKQQIIEMPKKEQPSINLKNEKSTVKKSSLDVPLKAKTDTVKVRKVIKVQKKTVVKKVIRKEME